MKNLLWIFILFSTLAIADFKHQGNKALEEFLNDYLLNPAKQDVPAGEKFGPLKAEVRDEIKDSPVKSRYFVIGMARIYLNANLGKHQPKFEKKFGKMDIEKNKRIWGLIVESVYAEKDDVIASMRDDNAFRNEQFEKKIAKVLSLKSLK